MVDLSKRARGAWGEQQAVRHFRSLGFRISAVGWRSPEPALRGDIDVVAQLGPLVVFCEVKARRDASAFGGAVAAVTPAKQIQVRRLAESWMRHHARSDTIARFDVVTIDGLRLEHYESAF